MLAKTVNRARPLLGTVVAIRLEGLSELDAHRSIETAFEEIAEIQRLMSFHEPDSDLSRLNRLAAAGPVRVDPHTVAVLRQALDIAEASHGVFDVTVASQLVEWGLLPRPPSPYPPHPQASWRDIELVSPDQVRFHRPLWLDLGGIAKGYAVDRALHRLNLGADIQCCINAGGDLRVCGPRSERVGLKMTMPGLDTLPVVDLENGSIASSSGRGPVQRHERRAVACHLHGKRRRPVGTRSFVSVVAERCIIADALTKIVLAKGAHAEPLLRRFGAAAYLHTTRGGWRSLGALP